MHRETYFAITILALTVSTSSLLAGEESRTAEHQFRTDGEKGYLDFKIEPTEGEVLEVDPTSSRIESWTDDRNSDVGSTDPQHPYDGSGFSQIGWQKKGFVTVYGRNKPAKNARSMTVEGVVKYEVGVGRQKGRTRAIALKKGAKFRVGPHELMIERIEKAESHSIEFKAVTARRVTFVFTTAEPIRHLRRLQATPLRGTEQLGGGVPS